MKKLITVICLAFSLSFAYAQDLAQDAAIFTHYHINPILINPGYAGFSGVHHLQMNLRNQWTMFPGQPATYSVNYNGPFGKNIGLGVNVLSEDIAQISRFKAGLNYAFRVKLKDLQISAGLSADFQSINLANSIFDQPNPLYEPGDFIVEDAINGIRYFDAALGFFGEYQESTYFGLSFPNMVRARLDGPIDPDGQSAGGSGLSDYYIFHFGHKLKFEEHGITINPSMMLRKIKDVPFQVDFNLLTGFVDDKLQAGVSYRSGVGGAVGLLLGTKIPPFAAYYSYDVSFQRFQRYNGGAHEVTVAFDFKNIIGKKSTSPGNN